MSGPAPHPTALKILRGNPGHRPLNKQEPRPEQRAPRCPEWLDDGAKREWLRMVPLLTKIKILTEADGTSLASLCQALSTMIQAQKDLSNSGLLIRSKTGWVQQSPLVSIVQQQMKIVNGLCAEFGLTPSSRTRIKVASAPAANEDQWQDF